MEIKVGHFEHFSGPFSITSGNNRSVDVKESMLLKIFMNGKCQLGTQSHDGSKGIGTHAEMSLITKFFQTVMFGSQNGLFDFFRIYFSENFDVLYVDLHPLASPLAFDKFTRNRNGTSNMNFCDNLCRKILVIHNTLECIYGRTIIDNDKAIASKSTNPTFNSICF